MSELGELLPKEWNGSIVYYETSFQDGKFILRSDIDTRGGEDRIQEIASTEADCRALLLIYLLENGLMKI